MWIASEHWVRDEITASLVAEVGTTPKPGLVDLVSTGSHKDLSVRLFTESAEALSPWFAQFHRLGSSWKGDVPSLFPEVRILGKEAEEAMFHATKGRNTHKGALFLFGIIATVTGYAVRNGITPDTRHLSALSSRMTRKQLAEELHAMEGRDPKSHGESLYKTCQVRGVRGEVMDGFPSVRRVLPRMFSSDLSPNDRNVDVLLSLMADVDDTCVLYRGGRAGLDYTKNFSRSFLLMGGMRNHNARTMLEEADDLFIDRNLSSGGAADLLAVTLFLGSMEHMLRK